MTAALEVTNLSVTFENGDVRVTAVRGMSYHIDAGEVVAIVGESGSGKTTAAMAVVGLLPEHAHVTGSVRLHGEELLGLPDTAMSRIRGKAIGTVFQDPMSALTPVYTVGDQIAEAIEVHNRDISRRAARKRAVELLDLVGIAQPQRRARAFPHELSGGERQRVVIAIAIANDPGLLICDEPTTALDVTVQAQILDVLKTARDVTGAAVLIITHDLGVVSEFADRAVVMYAGRPVEIAAVDELYRDRRMPYTVGLLGSVPRLDARQGTRLVPIPGAPPTMSSLSIGACSFAPRCPLAIDECRLAEPDLVTVRPGHLAACIRTDDVGGRTAAEIYGVSTEPPTADATGGELPVVLRVSDLAKTFPLTKGVVLRRQVGEVRAVDGVSFTLERGRTLGIVGESGSGKSTTLRQILELARPQRGRIEILGADVATLDPAGRRRLRTELQVVFQDPVASLDPRLPVFDVLAEPLVANGFDKRRCEQRVAELLEIVGLDHADASRYPAEFSGGQKQRIGIARALALQPKILALDEPVSALDVSIQAGIINLLLDLQQRFGLSYLFVSHDLSVVKHLAHRVAVMYRGTIVEQGDSEQVFTDPRHEYTRRLLAAVPRARPDGGLASHRDAPADDS
ncbi:MAG: ABC transporter ATP-binding protein [Mycobacterium sp.]|uniref:dipeptide ABC transporter ATP-binding protein n=1 Tax=Mycobacterium sp. TaxID=1785 RepID=UPI002631DF24|nr:ABC transporter ATP-binding protein [Mycobacterium sp.]MDI3315518.1 ABC transporter ATP-binding protein [Mycobacterium sp.]